MDIFLFDQVYELIYTFAYILINIFTDMNMKHTLFFLLVFLCTTNIYASNKAITENACSSQWKGKKVAYLGDSITDKIHVGTSKNYWQFLEEMLGIEPCVYGINGHQWSDLMGQAKKLKEEKGEQVDAIFIFAGTNDFYANIPIGEWYEENYQQVEVSGRKMEIRKHREFQMNENTFKGRINRLLTYLKTNFPKQQIILLTPIHRAYACFGDNNIQPDESYANKLDLYIDNYVETVKEAANVWAVPVIDLNSISGLFPTNDSYIQYFSNRETDRLHPNAEGHCRMAKAIMYQLLAYPSDFK